ncbi:peptide-methionine (S)-S-oxide reductase MsrA [Acetobacterium bakii]|uniref:Peptide methionine sulfoxide reductase MsrA n=1 Tax=Acetobacterium bakii TaxID=52689 RepID=A0A0L6U3D1_9FIRM|nr:peptide-methionine (S)-S-oxide reductase MsrA [Acetobacterium bakii]KNZ43026.1 methionine sulfoxide reductase A [Acetobacterium bakii]
MKQENNKEIILAGGCFWGTEKYFQAIKGVIKTEVGYANGKTPNPTYKEVCSGKTGHAEAVKLVYDASVVSLPFLLDMYYQVIDPVALNRQGNDVGTQYRTGIYYADPQDKPVILESLKELQTHFEKKLAIEVLPLENYSSAEDYHQKYLDKNPGGYCHIGTSAFKKAAQAVDDTVRGEK